MKAVKIIIAMLLCGSVYGQTVTPNPGPYQNINTKYQYTWQKWIGGIWNAGKLIQTDSAQFLGETYVSDAPAGDSSLRAANTGWIKRNITPGEPGQPVLAWGSYGNYSPSDPNPYRIGMRDSMPLHIITNDLIRLTVPAAGVERRMNAADKVLVIDTTTKQLYYTDMTGGSSGSSLDTTNLHGRGVAYAAGDSIVLQDSSKYRVAVGGGGTVTSVGGLSPLFTVANGTTTPTFSLSTAGAYTVWGNQTGSSATPSYGKLSLNTIDPTGGTNGQVITLVGGIPAWQNYVSSQWINSGSDIYFNNKVGLGITSPTAKLHLETNSLAATVNDGDGTIHSNSTAATAGVPQQFPSTDTYIGNAWAGTGTASSKSVKFRTLRIPVNVGTAQNLPNWQVQHQVNVGSGWVTYLTANQSFTTISTPLQSGSFTSTGTVTGISLTLNRSTSAANTQIYYVNTAGSITNSGGYTHDIVGFRFGNPINVTSGTTPVIGFDFSPTVTGSTGLTMTAFKNTVGINRFNSTSGSTVIGGTTPDASAKLEVQSTTTGFLPPRMTGTQAEAISSPAEGLLIYSTDGSGSTITSKGWWGYDGSAWVKLN